MNEPRCFECNDGELHVRFLFNNPIIYNEFRRVLIELYAPDTYFIPILPVFLVQLAQP